MNEFFYNDTLPAFGETRIIVEKVDLDFIGHPPFVFKPGMPFEGHLSVKFEDQVTPSLHSNNDIFNFRKDNQPHKCCNLKFVLQVALSEEDLSESVLEIYALDLFNNDKFMHIRIKPSGIEEIRGQTECKTIQRIYPFW